MREDVRWDPPGRGRWRREVAHFPFGQTPLYRAIYEPSSADGMRTSLARYGIPGSHLQMAHVHDFAYVRMVPLVEVPARLAQREPPAAMTWLLSRTLPRFRRRTRAARFAFETRAWREDGRRWYQEQKPAIEAANLVLQDEPVSAISDGELVDHLRRALDNLSQGIRVHFELALVSMVTVGDFLGAAEDAGVESSVALSLLRGASPASAEAAVTLGPVARDLAAAGRQVVALDDLYQLGPEAAAAVDTYLRRFGHRVVAAYDIDQPTLHELPHLVVHAVRTLAQATGGPSAAPAAEAPHVDGELAYLLDEARYGYGVRDDNAGPTLQWPAGLVRRAGLEAGARLVRAGRLLERAHVLELEPAELFAALGEGGLSAATVAERAARRRTHLALAPPGTLGPDEPLPVPDPLPAPLRRAAAATLTAYALFETDSEQGSMVGTGVGDRVVRGRARVAADPGDALAVLGPGDVLVVPFTTPGYNVVLPIVSALVVEEGGGLSHAAIVSRELGIPAVIGLPGATQRIADGAEVEVDPGAGTVRVLRAAPPSAIR